MKVVTPHRVTDGGDIIHSRVTKRGQFPLVYFVQGDTFTGDTIQRQYNYIILTEYLILPQRAHGMFFVEL